MDLPSTPAEALGHIARSQFRSFTKNDWMAFAGCKSENPLICDDREDFVIVIDGATAEFHVFYGASGESDYAVFDLSFVL